MKDSNILLQQTSDEIYHSSGVLTTQVHSIYVSCQHPHFLIFIFFLVGGGGGGGACDPKVLLFSACTVQYSMFRTYIHSPLCPDLMMKLLARVKALNVFVFKSEINMDCQPELEHKHSKNQNYMLSTKT